VDGWDDVQVNCDSRRESERAGGEERRREEEVTRRCGGLDAAWVPVIGRGRRRAW
jgi:hypothetical protein